MTTPIFLKSIKKPNAAKPDASAGKGRDAAPLANDKHAGKFAGLMALLADHDIGEEVDKTKVKAGHEVSFAAGTFKGKGKVCSTGKDGLTVEDGEGREHRVHWHELTAHKGGD